MTSLGNRNVPGDVEANETTELLSSNSKDDSDSDPLLDEMSQPWPATFERSISLLASPVVRAKEVDHFTRSPKPGGTPLTSIRQMVSSFLIPSGPFIDYSKHKTSTI